MKRYAIPLLFMLLNGCAVKQSTPSAIVTNPEASFRTALHKEPAQPDFSMRSLGLQNQANQEIAKTHPVTLNYVWFYERGQTVGQHLDAWARRFAYQFNSQVKISDDPIVKSDASFAGNFYAAIEDLSYFAGQGRASFLQYQDTKRLQAGNLLISISESRRSIDYEVIRTQAMPVSAADSADKQFAIADRDRPLTRSGE